MRAGRSLYWFVLSRFIQTMLYVVKGLRAERSHGATINEVLHCPHRSKASFDFCMLQNLQQFCRTEVREQLEAALARDDVASAVVLRIQTSLMQVCRAEFLSL
jgi:hypothetical protein